MKGEHVEEKDQSSEHTNTMFAKIHLPPHHKFHPQQPLHHPHNHFHITTPQQECDDTDRNSRSTGGATPTAASHGDATAAKKEFINSDGATIEVVRRPRGRPPGSKNKPKPPVVITQTSEPMMSPYVLELSGGSDLVESLTRFCRRRNTGLCILNASGTVANVTLRQPTATPGSTVTFHGRFDILSLSATIFPATAAMQAVANGFAISLAGPQGQIVGGTVVGGLIAAGTVYVVAASFNNPSYHRLPAEEESRSERNEGNSPTVGSGGDGGHTPSTAAEVSCGMSIYNSNSCQLGSSDVIWAPTARQPPPHY